MYCTGLQALRLTFGGEDMANSNRLKPYRMLDSRLSDIVRASINLRLKSHLGDKHDSLPKFAGIWAGKLTDAVRMIPSLVVQRSVLKGKC